MPAGAPCLKQLGHHGVRKVPPAPGGYQCLITAGPGGHCCLHTRLVPTQLPMHGLGHSLPHNQPRGEAASSVGTYLSSHRTSPNSSLQSISASYSSPTYRQPWKPSRTRVSCSALKQEGCSAAWSQPGGAGDPELLTIPVCLGHLRKAPGQNLASSEWDQGPACSCNGVWDPRC